MPQMKWGKVLIIFYHGKYVRHEHNCKDFMSYNFSQCITTLWEIVKHGFLLRYKSPAGPNFNPDKESHSLNTVCIFY